MRRTAFLVPYVLGVAFLQFASPWAALDIAVRTADALQGASLATLVVPLALILLAAMRGQAIGLPQLFTLPALALLVSGLPYFLGWAMGAVGRGIPAPGTLGDAALALATLVGTCVPLLLHGLCCLRGAARVQAAVARAAA